MNEIFSAIYARLTAQIATPVFDHVPQDNTTYPFVRINPIETTNDDTDTNNGFSAQVTIIAFSRYRGLQEINNIADSIYTALHQWVMPNTANFAVGNFIEGSRQIINDPDGITRDSIQQYTFFYDPL